jgi:zinc D-Ala-D-Ala carboxypeptidase
MQLSKNFFLSELVISEAAARHGLNNQPTALVRGNLKRLCNEVLQPLRNFIGKPVIVTSGYRSVEVNKLVGGSATSAHCYGLAADIHVPGMSVRQLMHKIKGLQLPFDQIIDEYGSWVHVGLSANNRGQTLQARYVGGKAVYSVIQL